MVWTVTKVSLLIGAADRAQFVSAEVEIGAASCGTLPATEDKLASSWNNPWLTLHCSSGAGVSGASIQINSTGTGLNLTLCGVRVHGYLPAVPSAAPGIAVAIDLDPQSGLPIVVNEVGNMFKKDASGDTWTAIPGGAARDLAIGSQGG